MRRRLPLLFAVLTLAACAKQAKLTLGQPTDGALAASDPASAEGPYEDRYTFDATANQRLRIEMTSDSVDAFLRLLGPDGAVITTNDDALGRDAAITFRAGAAGRYTVVATSFGTEKATGPYRVALADVPGTFADPGATGPVAVGETKDGVLELGDTRPNDGAYQDVWEFRPAAAGAFLMDLTSTQFDPKLVVQDSAGVEIVSDDDSGEGTNAQLTLTAEAGKLYKLVVTSFGSAAKSGTYRLAIAAAPAVDR
jgi:hypothetical protein